MSYKEVVIRQVGNGFVVKEHSRGRVLESIHSTFEEVVLDLARAFSVKKIGMKPIAIVIEDTRS